MPKQSSRGTHSSSDDRAVNETHTHTHTRQSDTRTHTHIATPLSPLRRVATVSLGFALAVVFLRHQLEGLGAAVGVQAAAQVGVT